MVITSWDCVDMMGGHGVMGMALILISICSTRATLVRDLSSSGRSMTRACQRRASSGQVRSLSALRGSWLIWYRRAGRYDITSLDCVYTIGGRGVRGRAFISISICSTRVTACVGSFFFWSQHDESLPKTCFLRSGEVTVCTVGKMT